MILEPATHPTDQKKITTQDPRPTARGFCWYSQFFKSNQFCQFQVRNLNCEARIEDSSKMWLIIEISDLKSILMLDVFSPKIA